MGWIGDRVELVAVLKSCNADKDENGNFLVRGGIVSFLGADQEYAVDDSAQYRVDGEWKDLLDPLCASGKGFPGVSVIGGVKP